MKLYKSDKVRFIFGLVIIILIYSLFYIYFLENKNSLKISRLIKHFIAFATTVIVYFVGTIHLGKLHDSWMSSIWHVIHISGLIILISLGLYDWLISEIGLNWREFALTIQEILISPVLYGAMGILNKSLKNEISTI